MKNLKNILIVDDDKDAREILKIYLSKWNFNIYEASNASESLKLLKLHNIYIALIDWILPGKSGLELCKIIRNIIDDYIYIIVMTGKKTKKDVVEALSIGADDYIMKPFNFEELKVRINSGLRILSYYNKIKYKYKKLNEESKIDKLTGLYNRETILNKFNIEYERHLRSGNEFCIIMSDIDFFKKINDKYGHLTGDKILKYVGETIKDNIRKYDLPGRYGGEEFLIILPYTNLFTAKKVAERIKNEIKNKTFNFNGSQIKITMSFGIASSLDTKKPTEMLKFADKALYNSKDLGRDKVTLYFIEEEGGQSLQV